MRDDESYPNCFDPYLRYAISTDFENFEFFKEEEGFRLFFLVEFKPAETTPDELETKFQQDMNQAGCEHVRFGPANDDTRYRTLRTSESAVREQASLQVWDNYFTRVELSLPLKPSPEQIDILKRRPRTLDERWKEGKELPGKLLLGVMDDGCPFAAAQFLRILANGATSTRVRAIWDQNQGKNPAKITDGSGNQYVFGQTLSSDFNYGLEYRRDFKTPVGAPPQIGFDDWIKLHLTPTGSIDEDGCYADAAFTNLMFRESHGAHVMDVLAGRVPTSSRIGPTQPGQDHRDPPIWAAGDPTKDPACGADVVFVQFPKNCIEDATGVWLKAYVLDGIRYILSFADPDNTEHLIINLSYGPTTGPHDGTAELEAALTAMVAEYDGKIRKPKLEIFLAAGNSYLADEHVAFDRGRGQPDQIEWTWRLPPDNPVLCFAEVWMDSAYAGSVTVTLTPPDGGPPVTSDPVVWGTNTMWRLEVGPTIVAPGIDARAHGDYTIKVAGIAQGAQVDAFVARTDPNLGARTLAKRSYFVDPKWEQTRSAEASCIYTNGEFDKSGSLVNRYGTLNGIATAEVPSVHVAGGDMLADGRKAPYSSAGPARGDPLTCRVGPDYALFCDESYALQGVRAGGTRSGIVFRLIGTSAAAPQLARLVTDLATLNPTDIPSPNDIPEIEKRGGGDLAPP